jgi:hypothetical protein
VWLSGPLNNVRDNPRVDGQREMTLGLLRLRRGDLCAEYDRGQGEFDYPNDTIGCSPIMKSERCVKTM